MVRVRSILLGLVVVVIMIDGSEKRNRKLVFELQSSRVIESCSKFKL